LAADVEDGLDDERDDGHAHDRDQHGAAHPAHVQHDQQEEADHEDGHRPAQQRAVDAQLQRRPVAGAHDARVGEAHERDEQADADGDAGAQRARHRAEDGLPEAGQHQDQDDDALPHDQAHGLGPGHLRGDDVGEHRVEAQAGGQAEREAADDTHDDRHDARDQRGRGGDHRDRDRDVGIAASRAGPLMRLPFLVGVVPMMSGLRAMM
jgi:hypothetical protein